MLPLTGKMFRAKSPVFIIEFGITSKLLEMIGSKFYHILVMPLSLFQESFIKIGYTVQEIGF